MIEIAILVLMVGLVLERFKDWKQLHNKIDSLNSHLRICAKDNEELRTTLHLLDSENYKLRGRIEGLEVEREILEREATNYKNLAIERKKRLMERVHVKDG